mmetsp:Transcript_68203/g.138711  ORF Transcript_68203/g.138711 Transcript_68203/m.138711 type:complete len:89 (+) Transcript_68203:419-685(+)
MESPWRKKLCVVGEAWKEAVAHGEKLYCVATGAGWKLEDLAVAQGVPAPLAEKGVPPDLAAHGDAIATPCGHCIACGGSHWEPEGSVP